MTETVLNIENAFPKGLLRPELFMGVLSSVTAYNVRVNLTEAGAPSGSHFAGGRYGKGEVGEFVLIEGQQNLLLGRVVEVGLPDTVRKGMKPDYSAFVSLDAIGNIRLLGSVSMDTLEVTAGVESYPRLGDRVYAAPHKFVALIPSLMDLEDSSTAPITLTLGSVDVAQESRVAIKPEKLFGRHCAILGSTGGGKSWTVAHIIGECLKHKCKLILLDATGEYRGFPDSKVAHLHLGNPVHKATNSRQCSLPATCFSESDFLAMFEPSGKVQGPKLRAAMRSLKLAKLRPDLAPSGIIEKIGKSKTSIASAELENVISVRLEDSKQEFEIQYLVKQIEQECVYPDGYDFKKKEKDTTTWGGESGEFTHCLSLVTRINGLLNSSAFQCVFGSSAKPLTSEIDQFFQDENKLMRVCMSGISFEYHAREVIANAIGRYLLQLARDGKFQDQPVIVFVDEAHNFLGRSLGSEDSSSRLDAFEIIAKEGRKFGLSICLATQRPRDITEGVLSQMGTLIVHRLTNDRDRDVVERACGEIDRAASAFLPNLKPGEAAIIGSDFPIPLTIQIDVPTTRPISEGPKYQKSWKAMP